MIKWLSSWFTRQEKAPEAPSEPTPVYEEPLLAVHKIYPCGVTEYLDWKNFHIWACTQCGIVLGSAAPCEWTDLGRIRANIMVGYTSEIAKHNRDWHE